MRILLAFGAIRLPYLVCERSPLTLSVFIRAGPVETGVKFARDLKVRKFTSFDGTVSTITAHGHARVFESAVGVGAVGEETAELFGLVGHLLCG